MHPVFIYSGSNTDTTRKMLARLKENFGNQAELFQQSADGIYYSGTLNPDIFKAFTTGVRVGFLEAVNTVNNALKD